MTKPFPRYRYVGPDEIADTVQLCQGQLIHSYKDFYEWITARTPEDLAEPFTFVIGTEGTLRLAPRRTEHVACARGAEVLSAGEMTFAHEADRWVVSDVSNQSTGYCPDTLSWPAVAAALSKVGIGHPQGFTHGVVFRRCPECAECNIVKDDDFSCVFCGGRLPDYWNVDGRVE